MVDPQREVASNEIIAKGFLNTLLPIFSWFVSQLSVALFGCRLVMVFRNPTKGYVRQVIDSWGEGNFEFSCAEILAFQTASGRRRARKKLKKAWRPFFRQLAKSPQCAYVRHRFKEIFGEIPPKAVAVYDIAEADKKVNEQFTTYNQEDVLEMFPPDKILGPSLIKPVFSELGEEGYW